MLRDNPTAVHALSWLIMTTFIFVAGAWHGSWCWSEIVPRLERAGHRVLTPDLLGMSAGEQTITEEPLRNWADQIASLVAEQDERVVLVGHSRAGIVISEVAERVPEKIDRLVYLCAFLLKDRQTLEEIWQQTFDADALSAAVAFHENGTCTCNPLALKGFYNDTPEPLVQFARERLVPEPTAFARTPIHVTEERFGSVPRAYIECLNDQAIPVAMQRAMQSAAPVAAAVQLNSDHSPFFSRPDELVRALERVSAR